MLPKPIQLKDLRINGFAAGNAHPGEQLLVLVRAELISDQPDFHLYMRGITNLIINSVQSQTGAYVLIDQISAFLLVLHADGVADLYIQDLPRVLEILAKHDIAAGEVVNQSGIADVRRMRISGLKLQPSDGVIICFKVGWKFALFFDLEANRSLDIDAMERSLGSLYRHLSFDELYAALGEPTLFDQLVRSGWFPFVEIIGSEFEGLLRAHMLGFDISGKEDALLDKFDAKRIDLIATRWWKRPCLAGRKAILAPALEAFNRGDSVPCLKIILTEIEGILQDMHIAELGTGGAIPQLLEFAIKKGIKKSESETSLLLSKSFLEYLLESVHKIHAALRCLTIRRSMRRTMARMKNAA